MERLTKRHGKHAVQIGAETRRNDPGWDRLAILEDLEEQGRLYVYGYAVRNDMMEGGLYIEEGIYNILGENVFLDHDEAEARLAELEEVK